MGTAYPDDLAHAMGCLDALLRDTVARVLAAYGGQAADDPFRGLYISRADIGRMLDTWDTPPAHATGDAPPLLDGFVGPDALDGGSRLLRLARTYGLDETDLWLLLIALAPEVDLRYERLYGFLQDDVSRRRPGVDLALTLLSADPAGRFERRARLTGDAPLVRHGLIELRDESQGARWPVLAHSLVPDGAVVQYLLGFDELWPEAGEFSALVPCPSAAAAVPADVLPPGIRRLPRPIGADPLLLYFSGPPGGVRRQAAERLAAEAERPLLTADLDAATLRGGDWPRILLREASLRGAVVYAEPYDALLGEERTTQRRAWDRAVAAHQGAVIVAGSPGRPDAAGRAFHVAFPRPAAPERGAHWSRCLERAGLPARADWAAVLGGRYRLTYDLIEAAVAQAATGASAPTLADLSRAAREQSAPELGELAHAIEPVHGWADLVLPEDTRRQLGELCHQVECRQLVLHEWGFGRRQTLGKGTSALFCGPPGTGKTTAAEIIAAELGLGLYKIDLAGVVSKYIGETEKNLRRIFAAAEHADAVLFFDEADALFGRRSEVRDSHDRYANIEIAYLLQQLESYEGVAVLATNLRRNMDEAFVRRLQFVVEFPFPDEHQRADIWRLHFPPEAPRDPDLELGLLARQFRITGGSIRNAVLAAAYLAAADSRPVTLRDLLHATTRELAKAGRVVAGEELELFERVRAR
ncbi:ATP-binding protein [Streptomyces sp. WG-D5]